jgi:hypothetical protein
LEYIYFYDPEDAASPKPKDAAVEIPKRWDTFSFTPEGAIRSHARCDVIAASVNATVHDGAFQLTPNPGALVVDRRLTKPEFALQLADGSRRRLEPSELSRESLTRLSATIPGSYLYRASPTNMRSSNDMLKWIAITNGAVCMLVLSVVCARRAVRKAS